MITPVQLCCLLLQVIEKKLGQVRKCTTIKDSQNLYPKRVVVKKKASSSLLPSFYIIKKIIATKRTVCDVHCTKAADHL
jgi:hypothetical protein